MGKGFFNSFVDSAILLSAVETSRDERGKPDPFKAAGLASGMGGGLSGGRAAALGAMLGAAGAFDEDEDDDSLDADGLDDEGSLYDDDSLYDDEDDEDSDDDAFFGGEDWDDWN